MTDQTARILAFRKRIEALKELVRLYVDPMDVRPEHARLIKELENTDD